MIEMDRCEVVRESTGTVGEEERKDLGIRR